MATTKIMISLDMDLLIKFDDYIKLQYGENARIRSVLINRLIKEFLERETK